MTEPTPAEVADQIEQHLTSRDPSLEHVGLFVAANRALIVTALRALGEPSEAAVERAAKAAHEKYHRPYEWPHASSNSRAFWRDIARAALTARAADE